MQLSHDIVRNIAISIALMALSGLGKWAYGLLDRSDSKIAAIEREIVETKREKALLELERERLELEHQRQLIAHLSEQGTVPAPINSPQLQAPVTQHEQSCVTVHLPEDNSKCTQIKTEAYLQDGPTNHVAGAYQSIMYQSYN